MRKKKAMVSVLSGLGLVLVTAIAIGFDLAVVNAGQRPVRTAPAPSVTAAGAPTTEWVELRMSGPGGLHDLTIRLHRSHVHAGIR